MKTKMIVKVNKILSEEGIEKLRCFLDYQWDKERMVICPNDIDIQAIIHENEKGEITIVKLTDGKVKKRKIFSWIKNLFKRKSKGE